jgi:hypothetical protein
MATPPNMMLVQSLVVPRSWVIANHRMAVVLEEKDDDYKYVYDEGPVSGHHGGTIVPDTVRCLWRDFPK